MTRFHQSDFMPDASRTPIPTPEEEATESARNVANKSIERFVLVALIMVVGAIFRNEIEAAANAVWSLL